MYKDVERGERALFPASISELLPEDHLARFFVKVVNRLDLSVLEASYSRDRGRLGYAPGMLLTLWIYGYVKGVSSSRQLEEATRLNLDFMYIANGEHPDHSTLANFRKHHQAAFKQAAGEVLQIAVDAGVLDLRGLAVDGTKLKAYASREKHLTAKKARRRIAAYEKLLDELQANSDRADAEEAGLGTSHQPSSATLEPKELERLVADVEQLKQLAEELEAEDAAALSQEQAQYDERVAARESHKQATGAYPKGRPPEPPGDEPSRVASKHLTDPDAHLMKTRDGIMPAYNAQAGVDMSTQLIVTSDVTTDANDKHQIEPVLAALDDLPDGVLPAATESYDESEEAPRLNLVADAGYCSSTNVEACEKAEVDAYIATGRDGSASELKTVESKPVSRMVKRMQDAPGRALYRQRKSTVETVFGSIKQAMGFRHLKLRGLTGAQTEWQLVCLAWNLKRLFNIRGMSLT